MQADLAGLQLPSSWLTTRLGADLGGLQLPSRWLTMRLDAACGESHVRA